MGSAGLSFRQSHPGVLGYQVEPGQDREPDGSELDLPLPRNAVKTPRREYQRTDDENDARDHAAVHGTISIPSYATITPSGTSALSAA